MLFPEEDAPLLKAWMVKRIEDTSDADAEVLAEYIIALLRHDGTRDEVRQLCEAEIPDFLSEDPKAFLDDVFQALVYKSYVPGAPPPPKVPPPAALPAKPMHNQEQQQAPRQAQQGQSATGRKRGYRDVDAPGNDPTPSYTDYQRPIKQARRQGGDFPQMPMPMPMPMPPFDPEDPNAMANFFNSMAMAYPGMPMPPFPLPGQQGGGRGGRRRRKRCRDFENKGVCPRGPSCMFDHGGDADLMPLDWEGAVAAGQAPRGRRGGKRGGGRGGGGSGGRAPFSAEGPVEDQTRSTIVVENIPEENCDEEQVRAFFGQFGTVEDVSLMPRRHLAIVKYDGWAAANAAYRSPKVIFDNRFVKVFWHKEDQDVSGARSASASAPAEPEIDPEEFRQRQEEAQRAHREREEKRQELERQRTDLERRQQELMDRHREEAARLQAKLDERNGTPAADAAGSNPLLAKLAALEREAKMLGIDPDAVDEDDASSAGGAFRGGWRGRGRGRGGPWRGGGRGGAPLGVGARHATYAQYSLDNRPKRVAITGADFQVPESDEALRHFLLVSPPTPTCFGLPCRY